MSVEKLVLMFVVFNAVIAVALWSIIKKEKP
jgi:hypothetical protein